MWANVQLIVFNCWSRENNIMMSARCFKITSLLSNIKKFNTTLFTRSGKVSLEILKSIDPTLNRKSDLDWIHPDKESCGTCM